MVDGSVLVGGKVVGIVVGCGGEVDAIVVVGGVEVVYTGVGVVGDSVVGGVVVGGVVVVVD